MKTMAWEKTKLEEKKQRMYDSQLKNRTRRKDRRRTNSTSSETSPRRTIQNKRSSRSCSEPKLRFKKLFRSYPGVAINDLEQNCNTI